MARKTSTHKPNQRKVANQRKVRRGQYRLLSIWQAVYRYRMLLILFIFVLMPALLGYLGHLNQLVPQIQHHLYARIARLGFAVQDIMVEGRERTSSDDLLKIVKVRQGDCLFQCDAHELQAALKNLPWVQSATVERRWPDVIYVRLVEHTPLALWQNNGKFYLIDQTGDVIRKVYPRDYAHLLVVVGKGAPKKVRDLLVDLDQVPALLPRMKAAVLISERRWDLVFDGLTVKLPQKQVLRALNQLVQMEQEHQLSRRNVTTIDLRLPDRSFLYVAEKG